MVRIEDGMKKVREWVAWWKPLVKPILIVFGLIVLGMLAILRANFSYMDDLARAAEGYKGWGNFSRYLSNFLAIFLNGNGFLTDISPWPQIVAAMIMAITGVLLLYIIYGRKKFRWWELVVVVMLALNPYFLECLSYKFDAPYIAVSVLMMVVPFLWRKKKTVWYVLAVMLGTLASCMTYQAALGILPMVTVVLMARMWVQKEDGREIGKFFLKTVVGYGVALLIFKVLIMKMVDAYVVTALPGISEIIPHTIGNLGQYYNYVLNDFSVLWLALIVKIMAVFVVVMMFDAKRSKVGAGAVAVVTLALLVVLCFGIYVVMEQPLFEPRAMFGFSTMVTLLGIVVVEERKLRKDWQRIVWGIATAATGVLVYLFVVFGFTYGNALAMQKEYTDFRIEAVINDLDDAKITENDKLVVAGSIGLAPALEKAIENYPVLARLVPVEFAGGYWGSYKLFRYYGIRVLEGDMYAVPELKEYPLVEDYGYHSFRRKLEGDEIVVELRRAWK